MERIFSYNVKNVDFSKIDELATKATAIDAETFDSLVNYLKQGLQETPKEHAQLLLARGLLLWIGHAQTLLIGDSPLDSPLGLVSGLVDNKIRHSGLFYILCKHAGIECEVVRGRTKSAAYRVGDKYSWAIQGHTWNIITVYGQRHLVHPSWATHALAGYAFGDEMLMEADGLFSGQIQAKSGGYTVNRFDDFWFCLHPKIFVNVCFPDQPENQLLSPSDMVKSENEFLALPFLKNDFYLSRLSLMSEKSCRLKSKKGRCQISLLLADKARSNDINFSYRLSLIGTQRSNLKAKDMPLLVLYTRGNDVFEFDIRFPVVGNYRFQINTHHNDTQKVNTCCEFRIKCNEVEKHCKRLPIDSGIEGYGYGPSAADAGLRNPSEPTGKVYMKPSPTQKNKENDKIKFQVDEDVVDEKEFVSSVYSVDEKGNTITHNDSSKTTIDRDSCKMSVELSITEHGEYSVVIGSRDKHGGLNANPQTIAQYFVSTDKKYSDTQREIKRRRRETKKENKISNKKDEKETLQSEHDQLLTEIKQLEIDGNA